MASSPNIPEFPNLPDYSNLKKHLGVERKMIIKINGFSEEDEYVRTLEDAEVILSFVEDLQTRLWNLFKEHPSLLGVFNLEFSSFTHFVSNQNVLDLIFLDDCLFPEKESFLYGQDGGIDPQVLSIHKTSINRWIKDKEEKHVATTALIKDKFSLDLDLKKLSCQCTTCTTDFRTTLREYVYRECTEIIDTAKTKIEDVLGKGIDKSSDIFYSMKKDLDKKFYSLRYKLKRSTLNRLESQVKNKVKNIFTYPSELAIQLTQTLRPFCYQVLEDMEYSRELLTETELGRFFEQISHNIWRNERYLEREFKKSIKSIVILKKTDISSKILNEYLGEFWAHSTARGMKRKIIYHMGPTNSGKTYHAINALCESKSGCYLAPLRLLAAELYDTMNSKGVLTSLLTGEEVVEVDGGTHFSSTIEMARFGEEFECCVIDEIQMIKDPQRGWAWTRALVNINAKEVHLCGDRSALAMVQNIAKLCDDELIINEYTRMTELKVLPHPIVIGDLEKNDALIVFSRKNALRYKMDLEKLGFKVSIVYGRLSPEVRREQARKFDMGETDVIVSTDAISMGMNLPIKRIVFSTLTKFFNSEEHPISISEIKQIAGRAGRYQRFPVGYATCLSRVKEGVEDIKAAISADLEQSEKCMVGPDLEIYTQVNTALEEYNLPILKFSEFLRLFHTMNFIKPFYCVELKEMIEVAEMVEDADHEGNLSPAEVFGFACAPVNLGLLEHVQYFVKILNHFVVADQILFEKIDGESKNIDYLETSIKCVELYQWLSRHFNNKHFFYDEIDLLENKSQAVDMLNTLLSEKIVPTCSSCGGGLQDNSKFAICESCFKNRKFSRRGPPRNFSGKKEGARSRVQGGSGGGTKKKVARKRKFTTTKKKFTR